MKAEDKKETFKKLKQYLKWLKENDSLILLEDKDTYINTIKESPKK